MDYILALLFAFQTAYAATAINLRHQNISLLQSFQSSHSKTYSIANSAIAMKETSRERDSKNTLHIRLQETHQGIDVLGCRCCAATFKVRQVLLQQIVIANECMVYQDLNADFGEASPCIVYKITSTKSVAG